MYLALTLLEKVNLEAMAKYKFRKREEMLELLCPKFTPHGPMLWV
jgi:hypothetical protein